MPERIQDLLLAVASMACGGLQILLRLLSLHIHLSKNQKNYRNDWTNCNDNIKLISGVCSSWLREKDPSMTLAAFQSLWCLNGILASVTSQSGDVEDRLELQLHLSATCPMPLC